MKKEGGIKIGVWYNTAPPIGGKTKQRSSYVRNHKRVLKCRLYLNFRLFALKIKVSFVS